MKKIVVFTLSLLTIIGCNTENIQQHQLTGYAQGTTFQIKYIANPQADYNSSVDSIFKAVDQSVSTYNKNSLIVALNQGDSNFVADKIFKILWKKSFLIAEATQGSFDATVGPLVRFWGFGPGQKKTADSSEVDSLMHYIGYQKSTALY